MIPTVTQWAKSQDYIYFLFDFRAIPFYVGKGRGNRDSLHEKNHDPRNFLKNKYVKRTKAVLGEVPKIRIYHPSHEAALSAEVVLIATIGRLDLGTGPLVNMTAGGEGVINWGTPAKRREKELRRWATTSPERRRAHMLPALRAQSPQYNNNEHMERIRSLITSEKRSEGTRKYWASLAPEQRGERARQREASKSPEQRRNQARRAGLASAASKTSEQRRYSFMRLTSEQRRDRAQQGGLASARAKTAEQRSELARLANAVRWGKTP